jgi:hypothetical protein
MLEAMGLEVARSPDHELPGAGLVEKGIADLERGVVSVESLLVSIGARRLEALGIGVRSPAASPEHRLYALLVEEDGDAAHSRYNALIRRLVSFERAAECAS